VNPALASEAEATAGTDNAKMMTPLVSKKAVDAAIAIKADKDNTLQSSLYASNAYTLGNPAVSVVAENIFANPPLNTMGAIHYSFAQYLTTTAVAESKGPLTAETGASYNVLTMTSAPNRAAQLAIESFSGSHAGEVYVRIRHIDNSNYAAWQEWRKIVLQEKVKTVQIILPDGITTSETSYCARDQFGMVHVVASVFKESGFVANDLAFTLPEGYRPANDMYVPVGSFLETNFSSGFVTVKANGEVICRTVLRAYMFCNAAFVGA
jgi:hypothetical protein